MNVGLKDLIKMTQVVITIKIMPISPETNLDTLEIKVLDKIKIFTGETQTKKLIEPIAFGLKALNITFVAEESKGSPDKMVEEINSFDEVNSAEISDVRRAIG